jgi:hypothetical protein
MAGNISPFIAQRYFDANGNPLAGGKLYSYQAGTTTPQATYTDSSLGTPNANPLILDSNGAGQAWLDPTLSYKFILKDSSDVQVGSTVDNVIGILTASAVVTASIANGAVTTAKLADDSVDSTKLKDDAVTDGNRAVTTNHIRDSAITSAKIAALAVTSGKLSLVVAAKTANYTILATDDVVTGDSSGGTFTLTMPAASGKTSLLFTRKTDTSLTAVTVQRAGSDTLKGTTSSTSTTMNTQGETLVWLSDGVSSWYLISRDYPKTWVAYTPTFVGFGTVSGVTFASRRVGDTLEVTGQFQAGTVTASSATMTIGYGGTSGNVNTDSSITANTVLGEATGSGASATFFGIYPIAPGSSGTTINFSVQSSTQAALTAQPGNVVIGSSGFISVKFAVKISGWN